ncbi:MICOS complex subunit Mic60-like [Aphis craccivora]|uniref:MICOS complex subunit Mic60-like n=1 Tax=Aphis craccivora TaxID=307492 RepID=A0A6G0ZAV5_APHCR|nr:MICOS complex subunit Mic60-like [Aphis craccivora]
MKLLNIESSSDVLETLPYEKVEEFQYLGTILSMKNDWSREIGSRITKSERAYFALLKFFKSKLFSKRTKIRLYTSIIRPILTYDCEVWLLQV